MSASPAYDNVQREKRYKDSRSVAHQLNYAVPDQQDKVRPIHGISYYKDNNSPSTQLKPTFTPSKTTGIRATPIDSSAK